jgi:TolB-like protein
MKTLLLIFGALLFSGCSNLQSMLSSNEQQLNHRDTSLHQHITQLARQLFSSSNRLQFNETVAVGSFLPVEDLAGNNVPLNATLGQQIQESLVTLSTQAGMNVIEYKTANSLKLEPNLDIMLSRDIQKVNKNITIDYFLTGTYTFSLSGLVVNARLIDVSDSSVIAAATDIVPLYLVQGLTGDGSKKHATSSRSKLNTRIYHVN